MDRPYREPDAALSDLIKIGNQLDSANQRRAEVVTAARAAAIKAVTEGMAEVDVARALGVDIDDLIRHWRVTP